MLHPRLRTMPSTDQRNPSSILPSGRWTTILLLAAAVAACGGERPIGPGGDAEEQVESVAPTPAPLEPAGVPEPAALPAEPDDPEAGGADAAVAVVVDYFSAIARRDFARAYGLWGGEGTASEQSFDDFRRGYADTASVSVEIGVPGRVEPAAGSRYVLVPVEIAARLTDGTGQCFRGSYTLRRSVVDGATDEERRWRIDAADVAPCAVGAGEPDAPAPPAARGAADEEGADAEVAAVTTLVERLGSRLARVSLLAPPATLRAQIEAEYGPLVTPELLAAWLADPAVAPGREVSSPWPARLEVREVVAQEGGYRVTGEVVYITSVEEAAGGAARREPVAMTMVPSADGGWRIADYERR